MLVRKTAKTSICVPALNKPEFDFGQKLSPNAKNLSKPKVSEDCSPPYIFYNDRYKNDFQKRIKWQLEVSLIACCFIKCCQLVQVFVFFSELELVRKNLSADVIIKLYTPYPGSSWSHFAPVFRKIVSEAPKKVRQGFIERLLNITVTQESKSRVH